MLAQALAERVQHVLARQERVQHRAPRISRDSPALQLGQHLVGPNLVELVDHHQRVAVLGRLDTAALEQRGQHPAVVHADLEGLETEAAEDLADGGEQFDLDHRRRRADRVDVALIELAEPAAGRPVGTPHRLNLVPLEDTAAAHSGTGR